MVTKILVAVVDKFCPSGLGIINQLKVNIMDKTPGLLAIVKKSTRTAREGHGCYDNKKCISSHNVSSIIVFFNDTCQNQLCQDMMPA